MKLLFVFICTLTFSWAQSQTFYRAKNKEDFNSFIKNGVTYIMSGDSQRDSIYIDALQNYWTVTDVEIIDPEEGLEDLNISTAALMEANYDGYSEILNLIGLELIVKAKGGGLTKFSSIGYMHFDGFSQSDSKDTNLIYLDQIVAAFNKIVNIIEDKQISKTATRLFDAIYENVLPDSKALKDKTLLIVGDTKDYVNFSQLDKEAIKYKMISEEEYIALSDSDAAEFCLLYFAYHDYTDISIFDLENNNLIFTKHFTNAKSKFGSKDIKAMKKVW